MNRKILLIALFAFVLPFARANAQSSSVVFQYPENPSISRFQGFTGYIPPEIADHLKTETLKVYVNGRDLTGDLRVDREPDSNAWLLSFSPVSPLPLGKINMQVLAYARDGSVFNERFQFTVDPSFDAALEPDLEAVARNPENAVPHEKLGKDYEKKRLFRDAAYEYETAMRLDPGDTTAREAYARIFAMWGEKSLEQDHVRVNVALDDSLLSMGGPVAFQVAVTNEGGTPVSIRPQASVLVDGDGHQVFPLDDLDAYVQAETDNKLITLDQYAQISYFMEDHPMDLLGPVTLHPSTRAAGYLAFPRPSANRHSFTLVFAGVNVDGKDVSFRFPFLLP